MHFTIVAKLLYFGVLQIEQIIGLVLERPIRKT